MAPSEQTANVLTMPARDPNRMARFQREAEVLASLSHPNIAGIYGLEEADGVQALVLESVEGPTLADRLAHASIPLDEALPIAGRSPRPLKRRTSTASFIAISSPQISRCGQTVR